METRKENITRFDSDWLASDPVFYNEKTGRVSRNVNDVIDFRNLTFHPEGLNNFLEFGYSVFEQTPVQHVKFLRHSSSLEAKNGRLQLTCSIDPAEDKVGKETAESDVLEQLKVSVQQWEQAMNGEIIVPSSGGYDSRLLNDLISDKRRIRSFTYGISTDQSRSYEVVYAKKIAAILGTQWERIQLEEFHHYFDDWDHLYGISTHAHGMYHMEFYRKIRERVHGGNGLLSGIIGDAWAGSVKIPPVKVPRDVYLLGYAHNVKADSRQCTIKGGSELLYNYFLTHKEKLNDPRFRVLESMRFKIILLSYLLRVPAHLGFKPWSPFLNAGIALSMLNLPAERRQDRIWQVDYFKKRSLYIESLRLKCSKENILNKYGMTKVPVKPLDRELLREIIKPGYIDWINRHVSATGNWRDVADRLLYYPRIGGLLKRMGAKDVRLTAYLAYLTLKPLEQLIIKRNNA